MFGNDPPVQYAQETDPRKLLPKPTPATAVAYEQSPFDPAATSYAFAMFVAWIDASRRVMDFWRTTVREQQDAVLAMCRSQLAQQSHVSGESPPKPAAGKP